MHAIVDVVGTSCKPVLAALCQIFIIGTILFRNICVIVVLDAQRGKLGVVVNVLHQFAQAVFLHELVPFFLICLAACLALAQGIVELIAGLVLTRSPAEEVFLGTGDEICLLVFITECPVEVPCRSKLPLLALNKILVEEITALGVVCLHVAHEVVNEPELCP